MCVAAGYIWQVYYIDLNITNKRKANSKFEKLPIMMDPVVTLAFK